MPAWGHSVDRKLFWEIVALVLVVACSETTEPPPPPPPPPPQIVQVDVSPPAATLTTGATMQLVAAARDASGTEVPGVEIAWSSENPGVATVSGTGLVSAVDTGQTSITALTAGVSGTAAVTVVAPGNSTIMLQPGTTYQTMLGWEATAQIGQHEFNSQTNAGGINFQDVRAELLDKTVNELGINRVRLETNPGIERTEDIYAEWQTGTITRQGWKSRAYDPTNDNNDPFVINPAGFHFSEIDADIVEVINPMRALLAANGETLYVSLCFVDFGGLSHFVATNSDEYAELMLAIFQHLQTTYGWVPDAIEMILEPDNTPTYNGVQIGRNIAATQGRLQAAGFSPDFVAPSTTAMQSAPGYFDDIITVPGALDALSEISYHRYSTSLSSLQQIAARGTTYNKQTSHLEWIGASHLELLEDLTVGNVSSWSQFTIAWYFSDGAASDGGGTYYNVDDTNISNPTVIVGRRTPFLQQYMQHVRRGAVRIGTTSQSNSLQPTAFINTNGRYVVVVNAETGLGFTVGGLPGGTYGISYTTDAQANVDQADVTITAGSPLSASIPAAGVITIYGK